MYSLSWKPKPVGPLQFVTGWLTDRTQMPQWPLCCIWPYTLSLHVFQTNRPHSSQTISRFTTVKAGIRPFLWALVWSGYKPFSKLSIADRDMDVEIKANMEISTGTSYKSSWSGNFHYIPSYSKFISSTLEKIFNKPQSAIITTKCPPGTMSSGNRNGHSALAGSWRQLGWWP